MENSERRKPSQVWAHAVDYLARRDAERLREFFTRTASYFEEQRTELFKRGAGIEDDSDDLASLLDERDELEGFLQDNRYFAIARAWGNFERIRDRIIFAAIHFGLLPEGRFVKNDMVVARGAWDALDALGIVISGDEKRALQELREKRHTIMHQGGMVKRKNGSDSAVVEAMKFDDGDVMEALALSLRATRHLVESFKSGHCETNE